MQRTKKPCTRSSASSRPRPSRRAKAYKGYQYARHNASSALRESPDSSPPAAITRLHRVVMNAFEARSWGGFSRDSDIGDSIAANPRLVDVSAPESRPQGVHKLFTPSAWTSDSSPRGNRMSSRSQPTSRRPAPSDRMPESARRNHLRPPVRRLRDLSVPPANPLPRFPRFATRISAGSENNRTTNKKWFRQCLGITRAGIPKHATNSLPPVGPWGAPRVRSRDGGASHNVKENT